MSVYFTYCKFSGVALHASDILSRFISQPEITQHPIFEHRVSHVMRIAANDTLSPIERRVIVAALIKNLNLVTFDCAILPDDYLTVAILPQLMRVVNRIAVLPETELKHYPRYRICEETRQLLDLGSYLEQLEHAHLWRTQGRVTETVASRYMEETFQAKLDDAAKSFNTKTVNNSILVWGFSFVREYETDNVPPRVIALMDILEQHPRKSWKALYTALNSKTRNLIIKSNLEELREYLFDLLPDELKDRPRRIVVIRYIDALIEGQQRDLMNHLAELGESEISKNVIKTVSGVSYLVKEVNERTIESALNRPIRANFSSAVEYAKAVAAYAKGR